MSRCSRRHFLFLIASASLVRPALAKVYADYANPPRVYRDLSTPHHTFYAELSPLPDVAARAARRLEEVLTKIFSVLPSGAAPQLRTIPFYLLAGADGRVSGMEYIHLNRANTRPDTVLDPRWHNCVVIWNASNYLSMTDLWALKATLHELSHAHHLLGWPENQPTIMRAWQNACEHGLYQNVQDVNGSVHQEAYALTNQLEYFAELSCMYFAECNYYPHNRAQLKSYDPTGYAMVEELWLR